MKTRFIAYGITAVLLLTLTVANAAAQRAHLLLKGGFEFNGEMEATAGPWSFTSAVDEGFCLGMEVYSQSEIVDIGAGFEYQIPRGFVYETQAGQKVTDAEFNFIPIYLVGRIYPSPPYWNPVSPYFTVRGGYNLLQGNDEFKGNAELEGGLHYGIGLGIAFENQFQVEALYTGNQGKRVFENATDIEYDYRKVEVSFGVRF